VISVDQSILFKLQVDLHYFYHTLILYWCTNRLPILGHLHHVHLGHTELHLFVPNTYEVQVVQSWNVTANILLNSDIQTNWNKRNQNIAIAKKQYNWCELNNTMLNKQTLTFQLSELRESFQIVPWNSSGQSLQSKQIITWCNCKYWWVYSLKTMNNQISKINSAGVSCYSRTLCIVWQVTLPTAACHSVLKTFVIVILSSRKASCYKVLRPNTL